MTVSNKNLRIMEKLLLLDDIRALVWVDRKGAVKARRGQAFSLKLGADDPTVTLPIDASSGEAAPEALYIRQFDDNDFLIAVFNDSAEFDKIKSDVDTTLD